MTEVHRSPLFKAMFWQYMAYSMKRQFNQILFRFPSASLSGPKIYIANHNTWWDGFFIFALNRLLLRENQHIMMREEQFRKYSFFRRLGVFSIDTADPRDVARAFLYSIRVLKESPAASLWIFPAGEMLPFGSPAEFKDGFARIAARVPGVAVVPVAMKIEYLDEQFPDVLISGGIPIPTNGKEVKAIFDEGTNALGNLLKDLLIDINDRQLEKFSVLLPGRSSVSDRYSRSKGVLWKRSS